MTSAPSTLGRGLQLLTGSRARALEEQAASRAGTMRRNAGSAQQLFRSSVFGGQAPRDLDFASAVGRGGAAQRSASRASHAADLERAAVGKARGVAALGAGALGVGLSGGVMATPHEKMANDAFAKTIAAGSKGIREATKKVQAKVVSSAKPLLSNEAKIIGGLGTAGVGLGVAGHHEKKH